MISPGQMLELPHGSTLTGRLQKSGFSVFLNWFTDRKKKAGRIRANPRVRPDHSSPLESNRGSGAVYRQFVVSSKVRATIPPQTPKEEHYGFLGFSLPT